MKDNTEKQWLLYILECRDGTLYTGITDNLARRLQAHRAGKGAKYTRGRVPLIVRYVEKCDSYSQSLRREVQVKRLSRGEKLLLCQQFSQEGKYGILFQDDGINP